MHRPGCFRFFASVDLSPISMKRGKWEKEAFRLLKREESMFESKTPMFLVSKTLAQQPFFSRGSCGVDLYLKNEAVHASGSLKHRLAKSLICWGLVNGSIRAGTTLVEASSGSTAISEAYYAQILGLPFIAVMASSTSLEKIHQIERLGGKCVKVEDPAQVYMEAENIVSQINAQQGRGSAYYMDQFGNASLATDFRGNNNLAERIIHQMKEQDYPEPEWFVCGLGTGGTATTVGRYLTYSQHKTKVCAVDPENSVFYDSFMTGDRSLTLPKGVGSKIEGIGRPRVEPSFTPGVIDRMIKVPDEASIAAMQFLHALLGHDHTKPGPSTGTNIYGCIHLIDELRKSGSTGGSIVTLLCDNGTRYNDTYYNEDWLCKRGFNMSGIKSYYEQINTFWKTGELCRV